MKDIAIIQVDEEYHIVEILRHNEHIFTKVLDKKNSLDIAEEFVTMLIEEEGGVPANSMSSGNVAEFSPLLRARQRISKRLKRKPA